MKAFHGCGHDGSFDRLLILGLRECQVEALLNPWGQPSAWQKRQGPRMRPLSLALPDAYFFAVRRRRFSSRRASSPNSSVWVGCGKMALATWVSVISPATIITPVPIRVSVWSAR